MNFGQAIAALQEGKKVAREGWNGKGMFILRAGGYTVHKDNLRSGGPITKEFLESRGLDWMIIQPHFDMWTAQNQYQTGWLASQSDMQADDWVVVE